MHDDRQIVEARLQRFVDQRLGSAVYQAYAPVTLTAWTVPDEPVPFTEAVAQSFTPIDIGTAWGPPWGTMWLHAQGAPPAEWASVAGTVTELLVDPGFTGGPGFNAEALVFRPDGSIVKAVAPFNNWVPVDGPLDVYIECAANPDIAKSFGFQPTHLGAKATAGTEPLYRLARVEFALRNVAVWELQQDVSVLSGLMHALPIELPRRHEILRALERMLDVVDPDDIPGTAAAARACLADVLARPAYASAHHIVAVGHAHIDSAWLWPIRETVRKCARTFSNMVDLMDRHPEFRFACSSAQQFAWIRDQYPALWTRLKTKVAAGQFIPVGGMWVEADTNMPGGEAMARQFIAGKRFFLEEFGVETKEAWLPDSFGYSAALPQIVAASATDYFLTQKISWNQTNRMPHHTFLWEGIDGTRVFTHFPPVDKYNSDLGGSDLGHAQRNYREMGVGTVSLVPFGWGDGGGGPTREMIAAAERTRSLEGSPAVSMGAPLEFFERAAAEYPSPPVWSGELYLEIHRGTYTSQATTKQGNRRSESLLREAELWAATAAVRTGFEYPYDELESCWHLVLLQQFHDILPGSSIAWVHQDAERNYAAVAARLEAVIGNATAALVGGRRAGAGGSAPTPEAGRARATTRDAAEGGAPDTPAVGFAWFNAGPYEVDGVPPLGAASVEPTNGAPPQQLSDGWALDNGIVRAEFDGAGRLRVLADESGRNAVVAVGSPLLQLHRDIPNQWDAWDIDEFYRHVVTDLYPDTLTVSGSDLVLSYRFGDSTAVQRISLPSGARALTIEHDIDWHENQKLLKLGFAFDVHADRSASETQFGHVYRPTHANTSWDFAKFEICAHRWVHVGEAGYGVAVANDSTYGHDIGRRAADAGTYTAVRLSLLRAPKYPDPDADHGHHRLRVSVRPGATIGDAVADGYRINLPLRRIGAPSTPHAISTDAARSLAAASGSQVEEPGPAADDSASSAGAVDDVVSTRAAGYSADPARTADDSASRAGAVDDAVNTRAAGGPTDPDSAAGESAGTAGAAGDSAGHGTAGGAAQREMAADPVVAPLISVSNPAVVVECVKLAEDRSGDVIVRLYESRGGRARTTLNPAFEYRSVEFTDLLERHIDDGALDLEFRPFHIRTVRFRR